MYSLYLEPVDQSEIIKIIQNLNSKKSTGPDNIIPKNNIIPKLIKLTLPLFQVHLFIQ